MFVKLKMADLSRRAGLLSRGLNTPASDLIILLCSPGQGSLSQLQHSCRPPVENPLDLGQLLKRDVFLQDGLQAVQLLPRHVDVSVSYCSGREEEEGLALSLSISRNVVTEIITS